MTTTRPRLEIVIDELVVRGLAPAQARVTAGAFEARLAALGREGSAEPRGRTEAFRRLPAVRADSPAGIGEAVAGAVWGAVS
jgi:hypothetical protein